MTPVATGRCCLLLASVQRSPDPHAALACPPLAVSMRRTTRNSIDCSPFAAFMRRAARSSPRPSHSASVVRSLRIQNFGQCWLKVKILAQSNGGLNCRTAVLCTSLRTIC
ncbi:uncharacterized protein LOC112874209 [Panicum hallii]|uniref:uncharacterized protein LOC112874209 n=1 Tax=Panicum hallii TaxID=206008 RepID=UPI000DF4CDCB|nr:uncharacterized protein LOC112874209 [Panicum hallii]